MFRSTRKFFVSLALAAADGVASAATATAKAVRDAFVSVMTALVPTSPSHAIAALGGGGIFSSSAFGIGTLRRSTTHPHVVGANASRPGGGGGRSLTARHDDPYDGIGDGGSAGSPNRLHGRTVDRFPFDDDGRS